MVEVRAQGDTSAARLLVNLKSSLTPRAVEERLAPTMALLLRVYPGTTPVLMTPWLSPSARSALRRHGIGYLDLTGNVSLEVSHPAIVIRTDGATRPPRGPAPERTRTTLAGAKASRLVRILADVRPPYRALDLSHHTGLSLPYVSRLLDVLTDQLLVRRKGRDITDVDWPELLRARAAHDVLLRRGEHVGTLAANGVPFTLGRLRDQARSDDVALTGSYAARRIAPVSAGGQLMLWVGPGRDIDELAEHLGLLEVSENADVILLRPPDPVVLDRSAVNGDGLRQVALSQLVLDCLSGPGRMPAEGEAVLEYMAAHEDEWRARSIAKRKPLP
ncbi:hypothetical protein D7319_17855 [Streptomyces radicis]|uniref:HTH iclR-type domain-containing protein n=2 Tax=Streptomyces radicis TaxID=1750517 RepID=A0A3A9WNA9_9ACTN|nr:hypothetical protein D7319_17855 [Streptomyces radicis]RKN13706.1 hypothetical protein D7318_30575 [Streptomyces radicis]